MACISVYNVHVLSIRIIRSQNTIKKSSKKYMTVKYLTLMVYISFNKSFSTDFCLWIFTGHLQTVIFYFKGYVRKQLRIKILLYSWVLMQPLSCKWRQTRRPRQLVATKTWACEHALQRDKDRKRRLIPFILSFPLKSWLVDQAWSSLPSCQDSPLRIQNWES